MAFSIATHNLNLFYPLNATFRFRHTHLPTSLPLSFLDSCSRRSRVRLRAFKNSESLNSSSDGGRSRSKSGTDKTQNNAYSSDSDEDEDPPKDNLNDPYLMSPEERREWRSKIREFLNNYNDVEEEEEEDDGEEVQTDPLEKRKMMQKLLANYPLVVEEDDPDWPEDADGWGFNLGQFFNKITIKNKKKEDEGDDSYNSEDEIVWQDDNYICPIKDITSAEWEEAVFKDISPLIVLVHHRYKRPKQNEKIREELEKAVHIIWNCRLPSPRCVAVDAVVEDELALALKVHVFPEVIFTKAGKILYREKAMRSADELSKIMAFFYYGAAKPSLLTGITDNPDSIPSLERT